MIWSDVVTIINRTSAHICVDLFWKLYILYYMGAKLAHMPRKRGRQWFLWPSRVLNYRTRNIRREHAKDENYCDRDYRETWHTWTVGEPFRMFKIGARVRLDEVLNFKQQPSAKGLHSFAAAKSFQEYLIGN